MPGKTDLTSLLPLKPVELEILLALVDQERHGYGLVQHIARRTDGLVRLEPGNLYRVIKRLLEDGLVQETARRPAPDLGEERRRYYRLTALGERVTNAELRRLRAVLSSSAVRVLARRTNGT
jgi:DNA-binding PadR family transcriptional regulator